MKNKLYRMLALLLCLCCVCSLAAPARAAEYFDVDIDDLDPADPANGQQYLDAINYVGDNGIMIGTYDYLFEPEETLNRAMAVTILYRMSGDSGYYTGANQFTDVPSDSYYYRAVDWGVAHGIVSGTSATTFSPHDPVTFQMICCFLHRLANYQNYSASDRDSSVTGASDYSSVSAYARDAVSWAYSFRIFKAGTSGLKINPKAAVKRKDMALYVSRYRNNVEGIKFGRDNFGFLNNANGFLSASKNRYCISGRDFDSFDSYCDFWPPRFGQGFNSMYEFYVNEGIWGGSCYGMSLAVILDHIGKIDLNGNCCNNVDTLNKIPSLKYTASLHKFVDDKKDESQITAVESRINMYHLSQFAFRAITPGWSRYIDTDTALRELISGLAHGGLGLCSFEIKSSLNDTPASPAHAVVAYGKPQKVGSTYRVSVYDPDYYSESTLIISTSSAKWTGKFEYVDPYTGNTATLTINRCKFENDFYPFSDIADDETGIPGFDIDGPTNTEFFSIEDDYTDKDILMVCATGDFTITNAEGASFHYVGEDATGDLEIYGKNLAILSSDLPCATFFLVDKNVNFTCVGDEGCEILEFIVTNDSGETSEGVIYYD